MSKDVLRTWVRLLAPFTPHLCEEIWREMLGERDFISKSSYPAPDAALIDREAELAEELVQNTLRDIEEILRLKKVKPGKVILYTSQAWKTTVFRQALDLRSGVEMKTLMGRLMSDPEIKKYAKEVPKFVQKISGDIQGMSEYLIDSIRSASLDELASLNEAKEFMSREIGCPFEVWSADSAGYDPQGKSKFAAPLRPAIYIE
ncbi:MAG TPA: class I tRNA ligase family protein [Candidatus Methanoperedenaceae archaeon]|nr:class I tRNA ligase family protein [Candidatus Methanoperedenaceae archaeon]